MAFINGAHKFKRVIWVLVVRQRPTSTQIDALIISAYTFKRVIWVLYRSTHISVYNINGVIGPPVPPWRLWWSSHISVYNINGVTGPPVPPWRLWWSSHISVYNINGVTGPPVPPWRLWWSSSVYTSASKNQRASIIKTSVAKNTCYWHFKYAAMERCELTD